MDDPNKILNNANEIFVNGVRFVRACDQTQGCSGTVTFSPPPKKTRGEEVAEKCLIYTYDRTPEGLRQPMRALRDHETAALIDAERKAERERCAKLVEEVWHGRDYEGPDLSKLANDIRALPD